MSTLQAKVPIIIGNLGARAMIRQTKGQAADRDPLLDQLRRLADLGVTAVEDYIGWSQIEAIESKPDFSLYLHHQQVAKDAGLQYQAYLWMHALPRWMYQDNRFVPFRCLEHGQATQSPSIFAPQTRQLMQHFFALVQEGLGAGIDGITLAMPCDYGEVGYPTGMGAWVLACPEEFQHCHEGYWCADDYALQSFQHSMLQKHGSLEALNKAWGTTHPDLQSLRPLSNPASAKANAIYRQDFVDWYKLQVLTFMEQCIGDAKTSFPDIPLGMKLGYGGERAMYGQDYHALSQLAQKHQLQIWSTHGSLPVHHHKRIQTLCRILQVPYFAEGLSELSRKQACDRLFEDAADGAQAFFEFFHSFHAHEQDYLQRMPFLRGEAPQVEVALLFNSSQQAMQPDLSIPQGLLALGDPLRDLLDYEILDEHLLQEDGALANYQVLVLPDPRPLRKASWDKLRAFAASGGMVVLPDLQASPEIMDAVLQWQGSGSKQMQVGFDHGEEWWHSGEYQGMELSETFFPDGDPKTRCRWTGSQCGLRLPVNPEQGPWQLQISLYVHPLLQADSWSLAINGSQVQRLQKQGAQSIQLELGPKILGDSQVLHLQFQGQTFQPSQHGESPDQRHLGLLLRQVNLQQAGAGGRDNKAELHGEVNLHALRQHCSEPMGKGAIIHAPSKDLPSLCAIIHAMAAQGSVQQAPRRDGVRVARFQDRLLVYNSNEHAVETELRLSKTQSVKLHLAALEMREVAC